MATVQSYGVDLMILDDPDDEVAGLTIGNVRTAREALQGHQADACYAAMARGDWVNWRYGMGEEVVVEEKKEIVSFCEYLKKRK